MSLSRRTYEFYEAARPRLVRPRPCIQFGRRRKGALKAKAGEERARGGEAQMDVIITEWGGLLLRWLHIIASIAWIGSSFYFMHIDAALKNTPEFPPGKGGEFWEVHGGGFYHVQKYLVAPERLPDELIWHKWEAYTTWISGFFLLVWIYYLSADVYLIDPAVRVISAPVAAAIGIGGLVVGWAVYDFMCRSPLGDRPVALTAVGFAFIILMAFLFQQVFSARGAFIHTGALMATIMAGNVLMVIIPNQRKVIASLIAGEAPRPQVRQDRQGPLDAQQLPDAAGHLPDDLQPLSAHLFERLGVRPHRPDPGVRRAGASLLQSQAQRAGQPVVAVDPRGACVPRRRGRQHPRQPRDARSPRHGREDGAGGEDRPAAGAAGCRRNRHVPLQHVPRARCRYGPASPSRPRACCSTRPSTSSAGSARCGCRRRSPMPCRPTTSPR